jgi:N-acyl-D-aspartate/D-glutamate deacylase
MINSARLRVKHRTAMVTILGSLGDMSEETILTVEEAIRKMTSFPAQRLRLPDRELLRERYWADIVIFDLG